MANIRNVRFLARTVIVERQDIDAAYRHLERIMRNDKMTQELQQRRYREKPYEERNRLAFEKCKRVYNMEMDRKINFLLKKSRSNPYNC
ncbi:small ribosomal subunit protein bS21m-like [Watersipora subatra]|uniref:small ribosomal subunit protein bS21m-like n=1 Tax=Watersipora subatra TaxID=2589382 RepID=UPI00355B2C2C